MNIEYFLDKHGLSTLPRDPFTISQILNKRYKNSTVVFYGAGKHTKEILENLKDIKVLCLFDDQGVSEVGLEIPCFKTEEFFKEKYFYDYIVISNHYYAFRMKDKLLQLGVLEKKILNFYDRAYKNDFFEFCKNQFSIKHGTKQKLIIISPFENADHFSRNASSLKEYFDIYKVVIDSRNITDTKEDFCGYIELHSSILNLKYFLAENKDKISCIGLNLVPGKYYIFPLIQSIIPQNVRIYVSIIDWLSFFGNKDKIKDNFEFEDRYDEELIFQKMICQKADGVINSLDGKYFLEEIKPLQKKSLKFYNYISQKYMKYIDTKSLNKNDIKLCYAGGIFPSKIDKVMWEDIKMIKVFSPLVRQNLAIDAYCSFNSPSLDTNLYVDYIKLTNRNKKFKIYEALPVEKLVEKIQFSHFGLMLYDFRETKKAEILEKHLYSVIPSKLFTYIAAGIPVIVSEELVSVANIVKQEGIGIVLKQEEISILKNIILTCNYSQIKKAVKIFQERNFAENHFRKLYEFIKN